jgi:hypothetical protein
MIPEQLNISKNPLFTPWRHPRAGGDPLIFLDPRFRDNASMKKVKIFFAFVAFFSKKSCCPPVLFPA